MEHGFDNRNDGNSMPNTNSDQVLPSLSSESTQNFGIYYEEETPYTIDPLSSYVSEPPVIYQTGSHSCYSALSSDRYYSDSPTADVELEQLLQSQYENPSGTYDLDDLLEGAFKNVDCESILQDIKNTELEQYGAAVVSPLDSGCSSASAYENNAAHVTVPQTEYQPASFQELFDSVAQDEASSYETIDMYVDDQGSLQPYDSTANIVPTYESTASIVPTYESTASIVPTPSYPGRKRGRKALPKAPVTDSEFHCLPCIKVFKRYRGLLQHNFYRHSGPKEHVCTVCGKKYSTVERLQAHALKHDNAYKPYGCPLCTKRFSHAHDMKRHIWTNHGEAPFSCSFCDKRFGRLDHMEQHEVSHKNNTVLGKKYSKCNNFK